jgi:cytochrome c oxidase subunit 2
MVAQGPAFSDGLRRGYLTVAEGYAAAGRLHDRAHVLRKAVAAADGYVVSPESFVGPDRIGDRDALGDDGPALVEAAAALARALDGGARWSTPADAAAAQVAFDTWLLDARAGVDTERSAQRFAAAIGRLTIEPLPEPVTILFATGEAALPAASTAQLDAVARGLAGDAARRLTLRASTDRAGAAAANADLARRRADMVKAALVARGADPSRIDVLALGEDTARGPDGSTSAADRRVEIVAIRP